MTLSDHTCKRPAIANMDHWRGTEFDKTWTTNRMCLTCGQHRYGPQGAETEYTRAQWDAWIATALDDTGDAA
jgi:hypothetical protein